MRGPAPCGEPSVPGLRDKESVADVQRRGIVIETDVLGMAQNEPPPRLPAGLGINRLPE